MDTKTNQMLISVVLDRSGSMNNGRAGTISGYNEYIEGLRTDRDHEYNVSLIQFDAHGAVGEPDLTISYEDKPLADVPTLTADTYIPRGSTPLYDAIGECVRRTEAKNRAVTFVIITDGENNASIEFTKTTVKKLIADKEAEGWVFVFIGSEIDSYAASSKIGVRSFNTVSYNKGDEKTLYANVAQSTMTRAANVVERGIMGSRTMSFFSDEQKQALGDAGPAASPAATGGLPNVGGTFPDTKADDTGKRPRNWKVTPTTAA